MLHFEEAMTAPVPLDHSVFFFALSIHTDMDANP